MRHVLGGPESNQLFLDFFKTFILTDKITHQSKI